MEQKFPNSRNLHLKQPLQRSSDGGRSGDVLDAAELRGVLVRQAEQRLRPRAPQVHAQSLQGEGRDSQHRAGMLLFMVWNQIQLV